MITWPDLSTIKTYAEIFASAFVPVSIFLAYVQIRATLSWNKKKTAEEALTQIISGGTLKQFDLIANEYNWNLLTDDRIYSNIISDMSADRVRRLDGALLEILRQLETVAIKIDHEVYDESICFDYLFSIVINVHIKCIPYIDKIRQERKEKRLFEHVEKYARKWKTELKNGRIH